MSQQQLASFQNKESKMKVDNEQEQEHEFLNFRKEKKGGWTMESNISAMNAMYCAGRLLNYLEDKTGMKQEFLAEKITATNREMNNR